MEIYELYKLIQSGQKVQVIDTDGSILYCGVIEELSDEYWYNIANDMWCLEDTIFIEIL